MLRGTISRRQGQNGLALLAVLGATLASLTAGIATHAAPSVPSHSFAHPNAHTVIEGENPLDHVAGTTFKCQSPDYRIRCYSPDEIRKAYNITPLLDHGITGAGRTIVIVDAYQSPAIMADLKLFDKTFGLPDPTLNIIAPDGLTPWDGTDANQVGWAGEITLDVEWAHAVAPGATIDLVLAKSNQDPDLLSVTKYAVDNNLGDTISQSFGEGEACSGVSLKDQEHAVFKEAAKKHMTVFASAGDQGSAEPSQTTPPPCGDSNSYYLSASTPASDPLVTGVGGTHLDVNTDGTYKGESVWNDIYGAGGSGYSTVFKRPFYQFGVNTDHNKGRGVPDVSYNGDVNGGVLVVETNYPDTTQSIYISGGTSAGSPQWAGITALADQFAHKRLGFLNNAIYAIGYDPREYHSAFHDITVGDNTYTTTDANGNPLIIPGYKATKGWDASTGWGTPNVEHLLPLLTLHKLINDDFLINLL